MPTPPAVEGLTAVDGKTLRGSFDAFADCKAAHISPVKMSRFDQAASPVTATVSAAVSASNAARITKAIVSAA